MRSPVRMARAGPVTRAEHRARRDLARRRAPGARPKRPGRAARKCASRSRARRRALPARHDAGAGREFGWHDRVGREVAGAAEVLAQRAPQRALRRAVRAAAAMARSPSALPDAPRRSTAIAARLALRTPMPEAAPRQARVGCAGSRCGSARRGSRAARAPRRRDQRATVDAGCAPRRRARPAARRQTRRCAPTRRCEAGAVAHQPDAAPHHVAQLRDDRRVARRRGGAAARVAPRGAPATRRPARAAAARTSSATRAAEDQRLEQRVRGQPVGAVHAGRGHLAAGPQAGQRAAPLLVHRHAAHVVVRRRRHRDRLGGAGRARRARQVSNTVGKRSGKRSPTASRASRYTRLAGLEPLPDRPRHHVARRQLGQLVLVRHEAPAAAVDAAPRPRRAAPR